MLYSGRSVRGLIHGRARRVVPTGIVGLSLVLAWASAASALTINGCKIEPNTRCPGANLRGANLSGTDVRGADLSGADLSGADLRGAILHRTNLHRANLSEANLSNADPSFANLVGANLQRATAHRADFSHVDLSAAALMGSDLTGSKLYGANLAKADFTSATVVGVDFVHAHFAQTRFRNARIHNARVIPSDIDGDHWARGYLFARVYTHVNAYGSHGDCSGSSGVTCKGKNDDPNSSAPFSYDVTFQWGSFEDRHNVFNMWSDSALGNKLSGRTNSNLGDFYVDKVEGNSLRDLGPTENVMPRGHPGGPIALNVNWHSGFSPGYSINASGWLPRVTQANHWGP